MRIVEIDMDNVASCVRSEGIELVPDYVNGGYFYESKSDTGLADSDISETISDCRSSASVIGGAIFREPDDIESFALFVEQAECLSSEGLDVGRWSAVDTTDLQWFRDLPDYDWTPLRSEPSALYDWAHENGKSEAAAYTYLLSTCPDPMRVWPYLLTVVGQ